MKLKQKSLLSLAVISALTMLNANANDTKDNVNLNEVTVTSAAGYEQKLIDAPASISIISLEDLQKKPYTNLLDAVRDIEGVDIGETRDKSGNGSISIRGMGGDYTMILI
ncbi:MAG: TonB-dependent receptor plug domain-containing protein, partial [Arcobacteraceae bacterium]